MLASSIDPGVSGNMRLQSSVIVSGEGFLARVLKPGPIDLDHTKYEGKRCPTTYHEDWLPRGDIGQWVRGQAAYLIFL